MSKVVNFKNVKLISVQDWDALVTEVYGKPYNYQQQDGCKERGISWNECPCESCDYNTTAIPIQVNGEKMGVSFKTWLDTPADEPWFTKDYKNIMCWDRNFYPEVGMIINDLHEKGILPEGDFGIEIDW